MKRLPARMSLMLSRRSGSTISPTPSKLAELETALAFEKQLAALKLEVLTEKIRRVQAEAAKDLAEAGKRIGEAEAAKRIVQVEAAKSIGEAEAAKRIVQVEAAKQIVQVEAEAAKQIVQVEAEAAKAIADSANKLALANTDVLQLQGLFSVRGMMEFIETKHSGEFLKTLTKRSEYSRENFYSYLALTEKGLTKVPPKIFGESLSLAYKNYSIKIHSGNRSPEEVNDAGHEIVIRESLLVKYQQVKCLEALAKYYKYPCRVERVVR